MKIKRCFWDPAKTKCRSPWSPTAGRLLRVCVYMHDIMSEKLHVCVVETTITLQHQRWILIPSTFSFTLHDLFNEPCTQHLYWIPFPVSNTSSLFSCPKRCGLCKSRFAFWYFISSPLHMPQWLISSFTVSEVRRWMWSYLMKTKLNQLLN